MLGPGLKKEKPLSSEFAFSLAAAFLLFARSAVFATELLAEQPSPGKSRFADLFKELRMDPSHRSLCGETIQPVL